MVRSEINNILFPTDFSDNTRDALTFALEVAQKSGATLHLMHSIEEPYDFMPMSEAPMSSDKAVEESLSQRVKKLFANLKKEIKKEDKYRDVNLEICMQTGRALYTILEETKNRNIDLIVMGAKGRTGLERILFGSTTANVIQRSKVPVLAVPPSVTCNGFGEILFATNYQDDDLESLQYIVGFAELFDSAVKVFHSSYEHDLQTEIKFRGFKELVRESVPYEKLSFELDSTTSFFDAIADQIENGKFSLLVMTRYQESLSLLKKRQTKEMSYYTEVPLLMVPGSEFVTSKNS